MVGFQLERFKDQVSVACDRAAQIISRTALLSLGLLGVTTGLPTGSTPSAHAVPDFQPFADAPLQPRPALADVTASDLQEGFAREGLLQPEVGPLKLAAVDAVPLLRPSGARLQDGTYLFGESSLPSQVGRAYMVFEVEGQKVSGAVYWPHSSYDCFEGRFNQNRLALRVKAAYSGETYQHNVAIAAQPTVVASGVAVAEPGLEGMHRLETLTENDRNILASCQALL